MITNVLLWIFTFYLILLSLIANLSIIWFTASIFFTPVFFSTSFVTPKIINDGVRKELKKLKQKPVVETCLNAVDKPQDSNELPASFFSLTGAGLIYKCIQICYEEDQSTKI